MLEITYKEDPLINCYRDKNNIIYLKHSHEKFVRNESKGIKKVTLICEHSYISDTLFKEKDTE